MPSRIIDHVVLLRFHGSAPEESIDALARAVVALQEGIDGVESVKWGPSRSHEGMERGFRNGFVMRLRDDAARDAYLPHPVHREVADQIARLCERVLVFDISSRTRTPHEAVGTPVVDRPRSSGGPGGSGTPGTTAPAVWCSRRPR